jgi:hypothetical protein
MLSYEKRAKHNKLVEGSIMSLREITALRVNGHEVSFGKVLNLARIYNSFPILNEKIELELLNQAAMDLRIEVTDEELQAAVNEFRLNKGLYSAADTLAWLEGIAIELMIWKRC